MTTELAASAARLDAGIDRLLDVARRQLGMDVVFLTRFSASSRRVEAVAGEHPALQVGRSDPLDDTYCQRLVDGRLPAVVPDARRDPDVGDLACTSAMGIGAHVGVPVALPDGSVYGTLCSFRRAPDPDLSWRDARVLRAIAQAVAELLHEHHVAHEIVEARRDGLRRLLEAGGPRIAVQPVQRLADGATVAVEALSRFDGLDGRSTAEVFAEAGAVGLGLELEQSALAAARRVVPESPVPVSVNGSAELWLDGTSLDSLREVDLRHVVIELTERQEVASYPDLNRALAPYRADGLRLAVDDTGAGWAGLQHVLELEPDYVKLDAVLVRGVHASTRRQAMVAALVAFAGRTGARVVAEGVETDEELTALRELGVEYAQGYLLGRPG